MTTADGTVQGKTQIFGVAPRSRAFTIAVLGDGFQAAQQPAFNAAAASFVQRLRSLPPYDRLALVINVWRVNVASTDAGADVGATTVRTYFDARYRPPPLDRLLEVNQGTALLVAQAQVPEFNRVVVIVNHTKYGGSGGQRVATFSLNAAAVEIALHELGHTFGLADEYGYLNSPSECAAAPLGEPIEQPNISQNTDRATLKWRHLVLPSTPIPTLLDPTCAHPPSPVPPGTVGLFEGARYFGQGNFRPQWNCRMRTLAVPFCAVCRETIFQAIAANTATLPARPRTQIHVVSRYPEMLEVGAVGGDGRVLLNRMEAERWGGWDPMLAATVGDGSPLTLVSRLPGQLDLFRVGTNNQPMKGYIDGTGFHGWTALGTLTCRPGSAVHVVSRREDKMDAVTVRSDGAVMWASWTQGANWSAWARIGTSLTASPGSQVAIVSRRPHLLDLFAVTAALEVWSAKFDERTGMSAGWTRVGAVVSRAGEQVTGCGRDRDTIDLLVAGPDDTVMWAEWTLRNGWSAWTSTGVQSSPGSSATIIAHTDDATDAQAFTTETATNRLVTATLQDGVWSPWAQIGTGVGAPGGHIAAVERYEGHVDLFSVNPDGLVQWASWDVVSGTTDWQPLGVTM